MTNVCNYADDTTFHVCGLGVESFIQMLEHGSVLVTAWFETYYTKPNNDKSDLLLSGWSNVIKFWSEESDMEK